MERSLEHELESELELEGELEGELELEGESELEAEGELEAESELEGESELEAEGEFGELEGESELESEGELGEHEHGEQFLGGLLGSLLGEGEGEGEGELGEHELEFEQGEQFFGRAFRGIGRLVKRAAPMLKNIARVAAPIAGKAVGGFLGGPAGAMLGSKLARLAAQQLREQELGGAGEMESHEFELGEQELGEHEVAQELAEHELEAEAMAHYAAFTESEHEAEALAGAAATITMSQRDRRALRRLVPNLVRGAGILTRVLRMRRATRPFVRVVPTIMRRTVRTLRRGAAAGQPITRQRAGQVMARTTRRVLSSPRYCGAVMRRNLRATRAVGRPRAMAMATVRRRGRSI